jgi:hypothetical protein
MSKEKVIEHPMSTSWIGDDGILRVLLKPGAVMTLKDVKLSTEATEELAGGKKVLTLVNMVNVRSVTREARVYSGSEHAARNTLALALLVGSPVSRVIGNFMIGLNKTSYPTRLFTQEDEALAWLKKQA